MSIQAWGRPFPHPRSHGSTVIQLVYLQTDDQVGARARPKPRLRALNYELIDVAEV